VHFQLAGQSESVVQLVIVGWQEPGYEVMVVHMGGGSATMPASLGAAGRREPPPLPVEPLPVEPLPVVPPVVMPLPTEPLPAHAPVTLGLQVKPAPQSESMLHGSCHLNAHIFVVVVVHISWGGLAGAPASGQAWLGGHAGVATAVPEQAVEVCA
jgi:hypothetical protein